MTAVLTAEQLGVLARAVSRAPSVHNSRPWQLMIRVARHHGITPDVIGSGRTAIASAERRILPEATR
jgi:hypothetical protein